MALVNRYRVWCDTDSRWVFTWDEAAPAVCPENPAHTIDIAKTAITESIGDAQAFTSEGAALIAKKDRGELEGNETVMKRLEAELAPQAIATKEWVIPYGKTWYLRLFAASVMSFEVESRLEYHRPDGLGGFEQTDPFDNYSDEPVSMLKLDGSSDSSLFFEGLRFIGEGSGKMILKIENKDPLDSVEAVSYFNGYESDSVATSAPVVTGPISAGAVSVSGTSAEPDGTDIQVYVNGTAAGAGTTVSGGTWTQGGVAALSAADVVHALATVSGYAESGQSNSITVA